MKTTPSLIPKFSLSPLVSPQRTQKEETLGASLTSTIIFQRIVPTIDPRMNTGKQVRHFVMFTQYSQGFLILIVLT